MSLQEKVMAKMKEAMRAKDSVALESLRAIKSEILLFQTKSGGGGDLTESDEMKLLQKLVKQRKDSADVYTKQGREDLAAPELAQVHVIEQFLPEQMSLEEVADVVESIIAQTGATSMKDMGRVMGSVMAKVRGRADGNVVRELAARILAS